MQTDLNLARKWRPKTFEQIIGQRISIEMLKNGLFLNRLFPVYLFAGQRGCGKTTTARVFGSSVNCQNLNNFQTNRDKKIPCLECYSCKSMIKSNHPDFIEIDAASHTGVDNVRQIIDSSTYMPLLGKKKIYLIDEAHMLSKAAFNALLKILEEPPTSVLFILATTEIPKIPATVLSRCFQILFSPIENTELKDYLKLMSQQENINIEDAAIDLIIAETEGSVRDAINLLERIRFSETIITTSTILKVLGKISINDLCILFNSLLEQNTKKVITQLKNIEFESMPAQNLWNMLIELCRALLWIKYGIKTLKSGLNQSINELIELADKCSLNRLHAIFQLFWEQEELFSKTNKKHIFLELILMQICEQTNVTDLQNLLNSIKNQQSTSPSSDSESNFSSTESKPVNFTLQTSTNQEKQRIQSTSNLEWESFLQKIRITQDPILNSIFSQAKFLTFDETSKKINLQLNSNSRFFKDKIEETRDIWQKKLQQNFEQCQGFNFVNSPTQSISNKHRVEKNVTSTIKSDKNLDVSIKKSILTDSDSLNIKDKEKWPLANLIISHFPGTIKKSEENI